MELNFTRPLRARCSGLRPPRRMRRLRSIPGARMPAARCMRTGWCAITVKGTICMPQTGSSSTTSPRAGARHFVTRKITRGIARILAKKDEYLYLGNLDARRDWGFAPEYVECMWKILQQKEADDYVLGIGETHSVKEFLDAAFSYAGLDVEKHVKIDQKYFRPTEVEVLISNPEKARKKLGWKPKIRFGDLVKIMVDADLRAIGLPSVGEGDDDPEEDIPEEMVEEGLNTGLRCRSS